jgi:threonine dehydrogenase-like Zn-dependent dehydrogenase
MRAVFSAGQRRVCIRQIPEPAKEADEAVVRVAACGICGSEMPQYLSDSTGSITGHEAAGVVQEPDDAGRLRAGDRVVGLAIPGCGECEHCLQGHENYCPNIAAHGRPWKPFGHADRITAFSRYCLPIPDAITFDTAIAVGGCGIGVAWHGLKRLCIGNDEPVPVIGVGPIGLAAVMVLKHLGAAPAALDISQYRLAKAEAFGAAPGAVNDSPERAEAFAADMRSAGVEKVVLCTSNHDAAALALRCLAPRGSMLVLAGLHRWPLDSYGMIGIGDKSIIGSWHYHRAEWPELLSAVAAGLPAHELVTHTFPFSEADEAYRAFAAGQTGKVVLHPE